MDTLSDIFTIDVKPGDLVVAVLVLVGTWVATYLVRRAFDRYLAKRVDQLDPSTSTKIRMIQRLATTALVFFGIGLALWTLNAEVFRKVALAMFASAGIVGIALGFAGQTTAANLVSGVIIAFVQPLRLGDRVEVEGDRGLVEEIGLFYTTLRTWDNYRVVIPNKLLSEQVIWNFTVKDPRAPAVVTLRIAYSADLERVRAILLEEAAAQALCIPEPAPAADVTAADDTGVTVRLVAYAADMSQALDLAAALRARAVGRLQEEGIPVGLEHLPGFPVRDTGGA